MKRWSSFAAVCFLLWATLGPAAAAPPGWVTVTRGPLELSGQGEAELTRLADQGLVALGDLERELGLRLVSPVRVTVLPAAPGLYPDLAALDALAPPWAAGFALPHARQGAIRLAAAGRYPYGQPPGILAHELAHLVLADAGWAEEPPRWFHEGVATRVGDRWDLADRWFLAGALLGAPGSDLAALERAFGGGESSVRGAYAAAADFVTFATERYGPAFLPRLVAAGRDRPFAAAWQAAAGESLATAETHWRAALGIRRLLPSLTSSTTLWFLLTGLFLLAVVARRLRTRRIERRWEAEEAAERAAAARRLADPRRDDDGEWIH